MLRVGVGVNVSLGVGVGVGVGVSLAVGEDIGCECGRGPEGCRCESSGG